MSLKANLSTEAVIRAAKSEEWARGEGEGEEGGLVSVGDASLRHTDVDKDGGGSSRLSKDALGSAALQAALTLHPCVHIAGCGEASVGVLHAIFSQAGDCRISRVLDEDGVPTGEASAMYSNAQAAAAAIERFDGERLDDGLLSVSVSKRAAQGSLTTRGRGRGKGKEGLTFSDRQQDLISRQMAERVEGERRAFASARAAALADRPSGPVAGPALPARASAHEAPQKKQRVTDHAPRIPSFLAVQKGKSGQAGGVQTTCSEVTECETPVDSTDTKAGGLLGLANYYSDSDDG